MMNNFISYWYYEFKPGRQRSTARVRQIVQEVKEDSTSPDRLFILIRSMPARYRAILDSKLGHFPCEFKKFNK